MHNFNSALRARKARMRCNELLLFLLSKFPVELAHALLELYKGASCFCKFTNKKVLDSVLETDKVVRYGPFVGHVKGAFKACHRGGSAPGRAPRDTPGGSPPRH